jgi:hypothetical protein
MFCRFYFISLIFLSNGFSSVAQEKGDTLIVFRQYNKGSSIPLWNNSCGSNIRYLIWRHHDTTYFQKFSTSTGADGSFLKTCSSTVLAKRNAELFNIVLNHLTEIRSDTIKPFVAKGQEIITSHPDIYTIQIKLGGLLLEKEVYELYLRKGIDELVNQNYNWNRDRPTARLIDQILVMIKELSP